jgi:hypothetical protein
MIIRTAIGKALALGALENTFDGAYKRTHSDSVKAGSHISSILPW